MEKQDQHPEHPQQGPNVTIVVDNNEHSIHRGHHTVAEIKRVGGVDPGYDLDQVIDGRLVPLPDNGSVTIKGGEVFQSHPKDGSSS